MQLIGKFPWWNSLFIINQNNNALLGFDDVIVNAVFKRNSFEVIVYA